MIFFSIFTLFLAISSIAQANSLHGTVKTQDGQPVEFANIILYNAVDTTQMITGTISDLYGNYSFENIEANSYQLVISSVGYITVFQRIDAGGNPQIINYTLEEDTQLLSELIVEGQLRHQHIDRASYTFTAQDIRVSRDAKDLLETLPELTIDVQTQNIKTMNGGSLRILVNGMLATDNELKLIPPDKVIRVEYFDFPPARYAGVDAVLNIITRPLESGYRGGMDLSHAFTTGFGNDNAYFAYNSGRHQFSFDYSVNYRDYKNREAKIIYQYMLEEEQRKSSRFLKDKFGYTDHNVGIRYTNQLADKYTFQVAFRPNFMTSFRDGATDITNKFGTQSIEHLGKFDDKTLILSPVLDIYHSQTMKNNSEISFNLVGTMFRTSVNNNQYEFLLPDQTEMLRDKMELLNRKQSIIGETVYTEKLGMGNWNSGYKIEASWLNSDIKNLFGELDYRSRYTEQYLYSELSGARNKFLYRLSLGGKHITNHSYNNDYNRLTFTPQAMLGYQVNDKNTVRLQLQRDTRLPSISQLSNNAQIITEDIVSRGNPALVNATVADAQLMHSFHSNHFSINTSITYSQTNKPINQFFIKDDNSGYILLTNENAISGQQYGGNISGQIRPFGSNILALDFYTQIVKQELKSELVGAQSNLYSPVYLSLSSQFKKWTLAYQHTFTSMNLSGAYLFRDENFTGLMARYSLNENWSFTAGTYWLFTPSQYYSETLPGSLVLHQRSAKIWDNKSMIVIGGSWNFNRGKDYQARRILHNSDRDAGTF
jgi:hypothetical protein